jgi:hypothetical protein
MALISMACEDLEIYFTEYSRNQLSKMESNEIEKHIETCIRCKRNYDEINELSLKIDKLIPIVNRTYEKDFIYRLFINSKPESLFIKAISIILIGLLVLFIFSSFFQSKTDYTSIGSLENRAKNIFKEDYYSHGQNK